MSKQALYSQIELYALTTTKIGSLMPRIFLPISAVG